MAKEARFPWVAASAVVAFVLIAIVAMLPLPHEAQRVERKGHLPRLGLTQISPDRATELLIEQIVAYDPAPLFIPTAMNSNEPELPVGMRPGARGPFADIPVRFNRSAPLVFPETIKLPSGPVEELRRASQVNGMLAMARVETAANGGARSVARVEVLGVGGEIVLALDLPQSPGQAEGDWQPLELVGAVSGAGLVGDLAVVQSSGSNEIDDNFRSQLRKNMLIGDRLPAGYYTFRLGR